MEIPQLNMQLVDDVAEVWHKTRGISRIIYCAEDEESNLDPLVRIAFLTFALYFIRVPIPWR